MGLDTYPEDHDDDTLLPLEQSQNKTKPLTVQEFIKEYDLPIDVADKLIAYQSSVLTNYRDSVSQFLDQLDRTTKLNPISTVEV